MTPRRLPPRMAFATPMLAVTPPQRHSSRGFRLNRCQPDAFRYAFAAHERLRADAMPQMMPKPYLELPLSYAARLSQVLFDAYATVLVRATMLRCVTRYFSLAPAMLPLRQAAAFLPLPMLPRRRPPELTGHGRYATALPSLRYDAISRWLHCGHSPPRCDVFARCQADAADDARFRRRHASLRYESYYAAAAAAQLMVVARLRRRWLMPLLRRDVMFRHALDFCRHFRQRFRALADSPRIAR